MKSVVYISALVSLTLTGCQLPIQETEYDPLVRDADGLAVTSSITQRTLTGDLKAQWEQEIEPIIQANCIQCHVQEHHSLIYGENPLENLQRTLTSYKAHDRLTMMESNHGQLQASEQAALAQFEVNAATYWPWMERIETAANEALSYYQANIESQVVQPVCTLCHRVQEDQDPNFLLGLSFYPYDRDQHSLLNGIYSLDYLIHVGAPYYLYEKAINQIQHGGGYTLQADSNFSQSLHEHGNRVKVVQDLLNQPPF